MDRAVGVATWLRVEQRNNNQRQPYGVGNQGAKMVEDKNSVKTARSTPETLGGNKMNGQILIIRIISAYFFLSGILTIIILFLTKISSALFLAATVIYILIMIAIAVGIYKLFPWARYAAITALLLKNIQFLVYAIRDIRTMNIHSVDVTKYHIPTLLMVTSTALYLSAIYWLSKTSTKEIFTLRPPDYSLSRPSGK
jgi:hypothetical protein